MSSIQTRKATEHPEIINHILEEDGCIVLEQALDKAQLAELIAQINPHFEQTPDCKGNFYGYHTKRLSSLVGKSAICREMAASPPVLGVMDEFLGRSCEQYQLNLTQGIRIGPGEFRQPLHRDDVMFPFARDGVQAMINCMWAVDDFTNENGATLLVPGSHKWPTEREATDEEIVPGIMPAGSVLIWLGSLLHAGGTNRSKAPRTGIVISYCLGWLRQAENQYLAIPLEQVREFSPRLQKLLGYFVHAPNLGCVEGQDPIRLLDGKNIVNAGFEEFLPEEVKPLLELHRSGMEKAA